MFVFQLAVKQPEKTYPAAVLVQSLTPEQKALLQKWLDRNPQTIVSALQSDSFFMPFIKQVCVVGKTEAQESGFGGCKNFTEFSVAFIKSKDVLPVQRRKKLGTAITEAMRTTAEEHPDAGITKEDIKKFDDAVRETLKVAPEKKGLPKVTMGAGLSAIQKTVVLGWERERKSTDKAKEREREDNKFA